MNLILFSPEELGHPLDPHDERARHLRQVLRKGPGQDFLAGCEDGRLGLGRIVEDTANGMLIDFRPSSMAPELLPIRLVLGLPRPIQANRILKDLTSLGLSRIALVPTELGEASYRKAGFYAEGGWRRALREGAAQAANPRLPMVRLLPSLSEAIEWLGDEKGFQGIVLDNKRPAAPLSRLMAPGPGYCLAVGSERGWTEAELSELIESGYEPASLGGRVLRTETACLVAVSACLQALGEA